MAEALVLRRSGGRALGDVRLARPGCRVLGCASLVSAGVGGGAAGAVGGAALLTDEANGFAADFTYATDAQRVAVKETLGPELITNGGFDSGTGWTPGTDWSISGGVATKVAGVGGNLIQAFAALVSGRQYRMTYTVTITASTFQVYLTGPNLPGLVRSTSGTYTEVFTATGNHTGLSFIGSAALACVLDNVSLKEVVSVGATTTTEYAVDAFFANAGTSPKMVWDAAGVLTWSPHNMLLRSENFTASWTSSGTPVVTAHAVQDDDAGASESISQVVTAVVGATYTASAWFLKDGVSNPVRALVLSANTVFTVKIDTSTGGKSEIAGMSGTSIVEDAGTHWKLSLTVVADLASLTVRIYPAYAATLGGSAAVASVGTVTVDRVQLNRGSTPTAYLPTTTAARYGLALDHDPLTHAARGLLCEPAATNLLTYSSTIDNAAWGKGGCTVTANAIAAPDGTLTADKLVEDTSAAGHNLNAVVTVPAGVLSIYAKAGERSNIVLMFYDGAFKGHGFNLASGTMFAPVSITSTGGTIQSVGNGWYRCSIPTTAGSQLPIYIHNGTTHVYTGDGVSGVYLWGAQLEAGTVATSHIPTFASATRAADQYNCTPGQINHSATAGSWWAEVYLNGAGTGSSRVIGYANAPPIFILTSTAFAIQDGTTLQKVIAPFGAMRRVASAFQSADRAITVDGLAAATDVGAVTNLLAPITVYFGNLGGSGSNINGYIRRAYYLPRRMSNAELQTETA